MVSENINRLLIAFGNACLEMGKAYKPNNADELNAATQATTDTAGALRNAISRAETADARIAKLEAERRWIPVSERLPGDREEVLTIDSFEAYALSVFQKKATVLDDNNDWEEVENAFYIEGRGINPDSKSADYPTHWMPLPEPPEVENV